MTHAVGDRVYVTDPRDGREADRYPGTVTVVLDNGALVVDGPRVDSRIVQFTIPGPLVETCVRPIVNYRPKHR